MSHGFGGEICREIIGDNHHSVLGKVVKFASVPTERRFDPRHISYVVVSENANVLEHPLNHESAYSVVSELVTGRNFFENQEWNVVFICQVCCIFKRCIAVETTVRYHPVEDVFSFTVQWFPVAGANTVG